MAPEASTGHGVAWALEANPAKLTAAGSGAANRNISILPPPDVFANGYAFGMEQKLNQGRTS